MRVKRYIYILLGVVLCLQACRRDSHPSNPDVEELAISMAASSVESTTRALINNTADLSSFRVDGYKQRSTSVEKIFDLQEITKAGAENLAWTYSPTRYWDVKCTYYFGAYSPIDAAVSNSTAGELTISAPNWQAIDGTEKDIIVATSQGAAANYLNTHAGTVKFDFTHILAQLEVQIVRNALLTNEYKLTTLTYSSVPTHNGTVTYTLDYTTPDNSAMGTVERDDNAVYHNATGVAIAPEVKGETTFKHLVVPFDAITDGGLQIVLDYTVNGVLKQATVKTGVAVLEAGKRYLLKLTFNSGIDITPSLEIADWIEQKLDEDDKYNW